MSNCPYIPMPKTRTALSAALEKGKKGIEKAFSYEIVCVIHYFVVIL